jgi:hypothetical protein
MMARIEASTPRRLIRTEVLRVLLLVFAAIAVTSPFLTAFRIGGVDALWYANMIRGVTDQIAAGHFPVPVGQGASAWNGGVHPFRSAPVFPVLAALWDVLTGGRLGQFGLQHLTVLTSAVLGTVGFYIGAAKIMPARRWSAAGIAFLYLAAPSWLAIIVDTEDYMSYMAFAALPLVLYGNARSVLGSGERGYVPLGAGLALVWMCHPPIAFITSIATLFIQTGAAISRGFSAWRGNVACAAVFAVLSAYYFVSMNEVPKYYEGSPLRAEVITVLALALFFIGLGRCVLSPRNPGWAACALLGAVVAGEASRPWLIWMLASTFFWFGAAAVARWTKRIDLGRHAFAIMFACGLLGAATAEAIIGPDYPGVYKAALKCLSGNTEVFAAYLAPISAPIRSVGIFQLGWGLDLALAAGALSLFGVRPLGAKVFFAASLGLGICFVRVPLVSNFLDGYFPGNLAAMCGVPLNLRIMPVIASFSAMTGVLWLAALPSPSRWSVPASAALAVLVGWGGFEAARFVIGGRKLTNSPAQTAESMRPENVALSRYAYDLMRIPFYYSNGETDPRFESRLLDASGNLLVGPLETAHILEARGVRRIALVCRPFPKDPNWIDIYPTITLMPGEHVLLRFEFDPDRVYNGYMMMFAEDGYREYHLPDSGEAKSFGIGGSHTSVLSLWNSGGQAEHYHFEEVREPGNDIKVDGGLFADLSISEVEPGALPVRLDSMIPYRASVSSAAGGWLETFVLYLPGYRGWVDGNPAPVARSGESLVEVRVPPGNHTVEVRFVGTPRLWAAAFVSMAGWVALAVLWMLTGRRGRRPAPG